jgi:D-glycero-alpha-D-manno-heptose-7-phosphate kinase
VSPEEQTEFHASAPVRLDFAGGWTDVPPFSTREARADLVLGGPAITLRAEDLGDALTVAGPAELVMNGRLDLLKAGLRMLPVGHCTLVTCSEAPPGSGLGTSGALDVVLVAVLSQARQENLSPFELAEQAWCLEVREAGIAGGRQDQCAAALGGFHLLGFRDPEMTAERLVLEPAFAEELERRMVLCYTGTSRMSGTTIARVIGGYERGDTRITGAFHAMKDLACAMADALRTADLARVGALLSQNWHHQQELDPVMRTDEMARLESAMAAEGVLGGKAAGSGAGGSMFFLAGEDVESARRAARAAGAELLPVRWASGGVTSW